MYQVRSWQIRRLCNGRLVDHVQYILQFGFLQRSSSHRTLLLRAYTVIYMFENENCGGEFMHEFFTVGRNAEIFQKLFVRIVGVLCTAFKLHDKNSDCQRMKGKVYTNEQEIPHRVTGSHHHRQIQTRARISRKEGSCPQLCLYMKKEGKYIIWSIQIYL